MKIMFSGAHGTGKSTLIDEIQRLNLLPGYHFAINMTRKLADQGFIINQMGDDATQLELLKNHKQNLQQYENVVMDRSSMDYYAYTTYLVKNGTVNTTTLQKMIVGMIDCIPKYSHVFYLVPEFPIVADAVRPTCDKFQTEIADILDLIMTSESINPIRLTGSVENRIKEIKQHLRL